MMRISKSSLSEFLARRPFSIVHVDANWNGYRKILSDKIQRVEPQFEQTVSFGYIDCDDEQEYAKEVGIRNVPSVAYYNGSKLFGVAIGVRQDIVGNIERLMRGELLDQTNILSRG